MSDEIPAGDTVRAPSYFLSQAASSILLRGILAIILGILALVFPLFTIMGFTSLFVAFLIVDGILSIMSGLGGSRNGDKPLWPLIVRGIFGCVVGVLFFFLPGIALYSYALGVLLLIAVWAIVAGALEVYSAIRLRKEMEGELLLLIAGGISIIFGVIVAAQMFMYPEDALLAAAWLLGIYLLVAGILLLILGVRLRGYSQDKTR